MHYVIVSKDHHLKYETVYYETDLESAKKTFTSLMCDDRFPHVTMRLDSVEGPIALDVGTLSLRMSRSTHYVDLVVVKDNIYTGYLVVPKQCVDPLLDHEWVRSIAVPGTDPADLPFVTRRGNIWELRFCNNSTFDKIKQNLQFEEFSV